MKFYKPSSISHMNIDTYAKGGSFFFSEFEFFYIYSQIIRIESYSLRSENIKPQKPIIIEKTDFKN